MDPFGGKRFDELTGNPSMFTSVTIPVTERVEKEYDPATGKVIKETRTPEPISAEQLEQMIAAIDDKRRTAAEKKLRADMQANTDALQRQINRIVARMEPPRRSWGTFMMDNAGWVFMAFLITVGFVALIVAQFVKMGD